MLENYGVGLYAEVQAEIAIVAGHCKALAKKVMAISRSAFGIIMRMEDCHVGCRLLAMTSRVAHVDV
jgi:hypothetical protein